MKLGKLLAKGRLEPVIEETENGGRVLVGYRRKDRSRKSRHEYKLKKPVVLKAGDSPDVAPATKKQKIKSA